MDPSRGPGLASGDRPSDGHDDPAARRSLVGGAGSPRDAARDASWPDNDPSSTSVRGNRAGRSKTARRMPKPHNVPDRKQLVRPEPSRPGSRTGQNRPVMARSSRCDVEVPCGPTHTPRSLRTAGVFFARCGRAPYPIPPQTPHAPAARMMVAAILPAEVQKTPVLGDRQQSSKRPP